MARLNALYKVLCVFFFYVAPNTPKPSMPIHVWSVRWCIAQTTSFQFLW
jgi:hypothetical protein